jgi:hypothetical protein
VNLPNSTGKSHWGEGITVEDMVALRWIKPTVSVEVGSLNGRATVSSGTRGSSAFAMTHYPKQFVANSRAPATGRAIVARW